MSLLPAVALLGLLLYVAYTAARLAGNDQRLDQLENHSYPLLEKADAVLFQFSLLPGLFNSTVTASEPETLGETRKMVDDIGRRPQDSPAWMAEPAEPDRWPARRTALGRRA